jgi:DNA modification methylase
MAVRILDGDCREVLKTLSSESVHLVVTSPPFWQQRDYGVDGQIGREATPAEYVRALVGVFREVRRVLRKDGLLFLNIGDTRRRKQLLGIPWRVALALQDDGWMLRQDIVWAKTAHKPERVRDRPTTAHEPLFMFSRGPRYFYDDAAVAVPSKSAQGRPQRRRAEELAAAAGLTPAHLAAIRSVGITDVGKARQTQSGTGRNKANVQTLADEAKVVLKGYYREFLIGDTVNLRSVWTVDATLSDRGHTAMFPPALVEPCIKAGCPVGGTVLDPFLGSGTTAVVAERLGRSCIGIELSPEEAAGARERQVEASPLFTARQALARAEEKP